MVAIVDCLWYLDGHHSALEKQSCTIPSLFTRFNGYNTPEATILLKFRNTEREVSQVFLASPLRPWHPRCFTTCKNPFGHLSD